MEYQSAPLTLTEDELDAVLRTVSLPLRTEAYWRDFPTRVRGSLAMINNPHLPQVQGVTEDDVGKASAVVGQPE
jgi:hypothetical protein